MNLKNRIGKIERDLAQAAGAFGPQDQIPDEEFMRWVMWRPRHADHPRPVLTPGQEAYCRHRLDEIMDSIAAQGHQHNFVHVPATDEELRRKTAKMDQRHYDNMIAADRLAATETSNPQ
jgi:hypothetical protein